MVTILTIENCPVEIVSFPIKHRWFILLVEKPGPSSPGHPWPSLPAEGAETSEEPGVSGLSLLTLGDIGFASKHTKNDGKSPCLPEGNS